MTEIITLFISNILTGSVTWFFSRKRQSAETDNVILEGLTHSMEIYKDIIESLKEEIMRLNTKIEHLESRIEELHKENKILKSNI
jgi:predicted  nucleic acid-binding Zn-ribbon protein